MKVVKTKVYSFIELNDDAKEVAIEHYSDINFYDEWYDSIYDYAEQIGLKITSFDLDRNLHCKGELYDSVLECCKKIIAWFSKNTDEHFLAQEYLADYNNLIVQYSDGINTHVVDEENEYEFDKDVEDLEESFLSDLLECFASSLQKEYEYLSSKEAIIDSIIANEYQFLEDGKPFKY